MVSSKSPETQELVFETPKGAKPSGKFRVYLWPKTHPGELQPSRNFRYANKFALGHVVSGLGLSFSIKVSGVLKPSTTKTHHQNMCCLGMELKDNTCGGSCSCLSCLRLWDLSVEPEARGRRGKSGASGKLETRSHCFFGGGGGVVLVVATSTSSGQQSGRCTCFLHETNHLVQPSWAACKCCKLEHDLDSTSFSLLCRCSSVALCAALAGCWATRLANCGGLEAQASIAGAKCGTQRDRRTAVKHMQLDACIHS